MSSSQTNRHRAGHHRSCFNKRVKGCRYHFPQECIDTTALVINGTRVTSGGVSPSAADTADGDEDMGEEEEESDGGSTSSHHHQLDVQTLRSAADVESMDLEIQRQPASVYINKFNPITTLTFRWNNDAKFMLTSPGIILYITNYASKAPNMGAIGAATLWAFSRTVAKQEAEAAARHEASSTSHTATEEVGPSAHQRAQRTVIATMMGANKTQEIGWNRVAYYYLYGSSDWHSHEFATIPMPQVLAYIRKQEIYGNLRHRDEGATDNNNDDASSSSRPSSSTSIAPVAKVLDYAWRPQLLHDRIYLYVFAQWFVKEKIPNHTRPEPLTHEPLPKPYAFDFDSTITTWRRLMQHLLQDRGHLANTLRFHPRHPQYGTHWLRLADRMLVPIINGPRVKSWDMLRKEVDAGVAKPDQILSSVALYRPWHAESTSDGDDAIVWTE